MAFNQVSAQGCAGLLASQPAEERRSLQVVEKRPAIQSCWKRLGSQAAVMFLLGMTTMAVGQNDTSTQPSKATALQVRAVGSDGLGGGGRGCRALPCSSGLNFKETEVIGDFTSSLPEKGGWSVALSSDGKTALVGTPGYGAYQGAVWEFRNNKGVGWASNGRLPVGVNATPGAQQGYSVALSANGSTALVGGPYDTELGLQAGAAWVFSLDSAGNWDQGTKLNEAGLVWDCTVTGNHLDCGATFGSSVALSADGNTAVVGGPDDNAGAGAVWVFARRRGMWSEQEKLVFLDADGAAAVGTAVAISADASTILVGGDADDSGTGAAWVFACSSATGQCLQQGKKLVGTHANGKAAQGYSVALSADGNTAVVGGLQDSDTVGAAWVFTRNGYLWNEAAKVTPTDNSGPAALGASVALSPDGTAFVAGGPQDSSGDGAVWVFTPSGGAWNQLGSKVVSADQIHHEGMGASLAFAVTPYETWLFAGAPYAFNSVGLTLVFLGQ